MALLVAMLASGPVIALVLNHKTQTRLLRMYSEKSGVPAMIMEPAKTEPKPEIARPDTRKRITIPTPGTQFLKKV